MTDAVDGADALARALENRSIDLLCESQATSGAFPAGPSVEQYRFCWLRDGSFIARALQTRGCADRALAFHRWVSRVLKREEPVIREVVARRQAGVSRYGRSRPTRRDARQPALHPSEMLPARYTLDGEREPVVADAWPNFQLDGYGTWLWTLAQQLLHGGRNSGKVAEFAAAVRLAADYLGACWELPCFDWWEEFGDRQHTSTLASVAAGLRAASALLDEPGYAAVADQVLEHIMTTCVHDGRFVKGPDDDRVDASLLSVAIPFELVPVTNRVFVATVHRIETDLLTERGGVRRYLGDSFFGGGPWILLTCWLAGHYASVGDRTGYERCERWVLEAAGPDLTLPEQVVAEAPFADWARRWLEGGPPADPLLWSHAAYLLMRSRAKV